MTQPVCDTPYGKVLKVDDAGGGLDVDGAAFFIAEEGMVAWCEDGTGANKPLPRFCRAANDATFAVQEANQEEYERLLRVAREPPPR